MSYWELAAVERACTRLRRTLFCRQAFRARLLGCAARRLGVALSAGRQAAGCFCADGAK